MNDQQFKDNLQAFIHGQLDDATARKMRQKMTEDPICQLMYDKEKRFDNLMAKHLIKKEAPFDLRESIVSSLENKRPWSWIPRFDFDFPLLGRFAVLAVMVIFSVVVFTSNTNAFPVFRASIERHIDCLSGRYGAEIETNNLTAVTKWFEGRLSFAVRPPDLSSKGAILKGARLCHLKERPVALLFYEKDGHKITFYMMESENLKMSEGKKLNIPGKELYLYNDQGYYSLVCLHERHPGVGYVVVTDLAEADLINLFS